MKRLPATIDDLAGARAARWIRESTPGQFDRDGPEAQAEFQDRAIRGSCRRPGATPREGGPGRQLLATALFDRIEVLGIREATVHLSAHAVRHGLAAALPAELGILVNGRGERSQDDDFDRSANGDPLSPRVRRRLVRRRA